MNKLERIVLLTAVLCVSLFSLQVSALEVKVMITGETHSALYPCDCPKEPDGGVARRAGLIKDIREESEYTLLLETGGFFAAGTHDAYSQNVELDKQRTQIYIRSLELMKYDAVGIGDDEFNFGSDFLTRALGKSSLKFVSANVRLDNVIPYIIKEIEGVRFGIIGATGIDTRQKAGVVEVSEPFASLKQYVAELKAEGADFVILLSHMGEEEDLRLLDEVPDIDILVVSQSRVSNEPYSKKGDVLIVRPAWQARRLGILNLQIKNKKIVNAKFGELRLSDKVADEPAILEILPECFQDINCKQDPLLGTCLNRGSEKAKCEFSKPVEVELTVVSPKICPACKTDVALERLKKLVLGIKVKNLHYESRRGKKIVAELKVNALPVFLFDRKITEAKGYKSLKPNLINKGKFYMVNPDFIGIAHFLDRQEIKPRLDLFVSLYDKNAPRILDVVKQFEPGIHFLAVESSGRFDAPKGLREIEENLRAVCLMQHYPDKSYDYLRCRSSNIESSWWQDCAEDIDLEKVRSCATSDEGRQFLKKNIALNKELKIMYGPTYLINNVEIISSVEAPQAAELKRLIKGIR